MNNHWIKTCIFLSPFRLFFISASFLYCGCEQKPEKVEHRLVQNKVFVVADEIDSTEIKKQRFLENNKDSSYIEFVFKNYDLVNIHELDSTIKVDLRYADTTNFLRRNMYDGLRKAYFTCETAIRIAAAQYYLKQVAPHLSLVILDASRPQHIQKLMWDSLEMHPRQKFNYLSPPEETSLHNYGCAVDVTILDERTGKNLDMGTRYDTFTKLSQPVYEAHFLKTGELSRDAYQNRILLRKIMKRAKLNSINTEWWHFSSVSKNEAIRRFRLIK